MNLRMVGRIASGAFLALSAAVFAYGLFGLSRFNWYRGAYFDDSLILFDNGFYAFFWGSLLLSIGLLMRLRRGREFTLAAMGAGLTLLLWMRATVPAIRDTGEELFPDAGLLNALIFVCCVLGLLALADRQVQLVIDLLILRPFRKIKSLLRGG